MSSIYRDVSKSAPKSDVQRSAGSQWLRESPKEAERSRPVKKRRRGLHGVVRSMRQSYPSRGDRWRDVSSPSESDIERVNANRGRELPTNNMGDPSSWSHRIGTYVIGTACVAMIATMILTMWVQNGLSFDLTTLSLPYLLGAVVAFVVLTVVLWLYLTYGRDVQRSKSWWGAILTSMGCVLIIATVALLAYSFYHVE